MPELSAELWSLATIAAAQLLAVVSPGPSFLITAQTAVARSRLEGVKVAAGLAAGTLVWAGAVLFGLNALLLAMPAVFLIVKVAGAVFLLWIAYKIYIHAAEPLALSGAAVEGNAFWRGLLVQLGNPKVMIFFGSIFVSMLPANPPSWLILALWFVVTFNELWWYTLVALFFGGGSVRNFYLRSKASIDRITGAFLGLLGLRLLWGVASEG